MKPQPKTDEPNVSLETLARTALIECDNDTERAISLLSEKLRKDRQLREMVIRSALEIAIRERVNLVIRNQRTAILNQVNNVPSRNRVIALAAGNAMGLLDFPLAGGILLRDARRPEIMQQVVIYEIRSEDMAHKARWLRLVHDAVPEDKSVGEALTEKQVEELYKGEK